MRLIEHIKHAKLNLQQWCQHAHQCVGKFILHLDGLHLHGDGRGAGLDPAQLLGGLRLPLQHLDRARHGPGVVGEVYVGDLQIQLTCSQALDTFTQLL